jgi:hypothetical protein
MEAPDPVEAEEVLVQVVVLERRQMAMDMHMVQLRVPNRGLSMVISLVLVQRHEQVLQEVNRRDLVGNGLIQHLEPLVRVQTIIQTRTQIQIQTQGQIRVRRIMQQRELGRKHERRRREKRKNEKPRRQKRRERRIWRRD